MEREFWQEKWNANEIGFHQDAVHPLLDKYFKKLELERGSRVFVPLCGKSRDMVYLLEQGYKVIGLELSERASQSFFDENNLDVNIRHVGEHILFQSADIEIICGDFFSVPSDLLGGFSAVFDRAALIALPPAMRLQYVQKMQQLSGRDIEMLLITLEYEQGIVNPPPFAVEQSEVDSLYGDWCDLDMLEKASSEVKGKPCYEKAFRLKVL